MHKPPFHPTSPSFMRFGRKILPGLHFVRSAPHQGVPLHDFPQNNTELSHITLVILALSESLPSPDCSDLIIGSSSSSMLGEPTWWIWEPPYLTNKAMFSEIALCKGSHQKKGPNPCFHTWLAIPVSLALALPVTPWGIRISAW